MKKLKSHHIAFLMGVVVTVILSTIYLTIKNGEIITIFSNIH